MRIPTLCIALVLTSVVAFADATVEQKSQVHFGGAMGGMINAFGGKAMREGLVSSTAIKGNRKLTRTGDRGELVDLDAEKVYNLDFAGKTYTVTTFDELRKRFEEQQARAEKSSARQSRRDEKNGPEWEVEFSIKSTGKAETINGWNTHEEIATVIMHEKGKKLEQSGGFILTSDMWMGPHLAAMRELSEFERRYIQKVYGNSFDAEMVKMAAMMSTQPAFGKAMKAFNEHKGKLEGTPVRTTTTFETVPGPATQQEASNDESSPTSALLGGLMKRARERQAEKQGQSGSGSGHSSMFDSITELLKATTSASSADVSIPPGFRAR